MLRCFVIIQAMKTRGDCVEEFATFAHHVQSCRRNADSIRQRLDNTIALFEATANICCLTVARVVSYGNSTYSVPTECCFVHLSVHWKIDNHYIKSSELSDVDGQSSRVQGIR